MDKLPVFREVPYNFFKNEDMADIRKIFCPAENLNMKIDSVKCLSCKYHLGLKEDFTETSPGEYTAHIYCANIMSKEYEAKKQSQTASADTSPGKGEEG